MSKKMANTEVYFTHWPFLFIKSGPYQLIYHYWAINFLIYGLIVTNYPVNISTGSNPTCIEGSSI